MFELKNKVALVTGSSRGLGAGIALALGEAGADVVVNYRSKRKEAENICRQIVDMGAGRRAITVQADVSSQSDVDALFTETINKFGRLDILVNNAGTSKPQDIFETALDDWEYIIKNNLTGIFLCSKAAMKIMRTQKDGRIINISSIVSQRGALYGHVHYAASKSGIIGFTKTLARTAAPFNITVNAIAPGIIETELLYQTHGNKEVKKLAASVPLGLGTTRDVGLAVVYLAGEGGRYITGATIDINGGMNYR